MKRSITSITTSRARANAQPAMAVGIAKHAARLAITGMRTWVCKLGETGYRAGIDVAAFSAKDQTVNRITRFAALVGAVSDSPQYVSRNTFLQHLI